MISELVAKIKNEDYEAIINDIAGLFAKLFDFILEKMGVEAE